MNLTFPRSERLSGPIDQRSELRHSRRSARVRQEELLRMANHQEPTPHPPRSSFSPSRFRKQCFSARKLWIYEYKYKRKIVIEKLFETRHTIFRTRQFRGGIRLLIRNAFLEFLQKIGMLTRVLSSSEIHVLRQLVRKCHPGKTYRYRFVLFTDRGHLGEILHFWEAYVYPSIEQMVLAEFESQ